MKVFVLFHADIEDDRYVRGVYATREAAEGDVTADEWINYADSPYRRRHHEYCCSVDETEVLEASTPMQLGPFIDELRDPNATGLIRYDLEAAIFQMVAAPSMFDRFREIGRVTKTEDMGTGLVEATLDEQGEVGDRHR